MATKSIGLTGRDYSTLAAWCSYVNALALSATEIGEVYNDGEVSDSSYCILSGYTGSSGSNQVILRPASGHGFKDHASAATNPLRYDASKGAALTNSVGGTSGGCYRFDGSDIIVDGLQFKSTDDSALTMRMGVVNGGVLKNSLIDSNSGYGALKMDSAWSVFENLAIVQRYSSGVGISLAGPGTNSFAMVRGCTVINVSGSSSASGLTASSGTPTVINTAVYGFNTAFDGDSSYHASNCTNNATSLGSFTASNCNPSGQTSITSADFVSVTSGSEDLRPASSSTKLINTGATSGLGIDIFGTSRPQGGSYDIGAAEYVSAGDTTAPTLTSPTGTQTGSTTGSGTVTTDEANGTLYSWATTNATETVAAIKASGATQTITTTGSKGVTFSGLTPSTAYYAHYVHRDAAGNDSTASNSASFTTTSGSGSAAIGASAARRSQSGVNSFGLRR